MNNYFLRSLYRNKEVAYTASSIVATFWFKNAYSTSLFNSNYVNSWPESMIMGTFWPVSIPSAIFADKQKDN